MEGLQGLQNLIPGDNQGRNSADGVAPRATGEEQHWVMVELGLPPGFEVVGEDLEALIAQSAAQKTRIKRYEITGRTLQLYLENLSAPVRFNFRLRARLAVRAQTGAATAYDYYNPTLRDVQPPLLMVVEP